MTTTAQITATIAELDAEIAELDAEIAELDAAIISVAAAGFDTHDMERLVAAFRRQRAHLTAALAA